MDRESSEPWSHVGPAVPVSQLCPGTRYHVVVDDCCVQAEFISRFVRWEPDDGEAAGTGTARFADGTRLRNLVWFAYPAADDAG